MAMMSTSPSSRLSNSNLSPREIPYFDYFRYNVAAKLSNQCRGKFWETTLLREAAQDDCVSDCILSVGALARALWGVPSNRPLFKTGLCGSSTDVHYREAIKYYIRALSKFRRLITKGDGVVAPRTVLIATILFFAFELLQGNTEACDKILANGLITLKGKMLCPKNEEGPSSVAGTMNDDGIQDAEFALMRVAALGAVSSPMYPAGRQSVLLSDIPLTPWLQPLGPEDSLKEFWTMWLHKLTLTIVWLLRVAALSDEGASIHEDETLQKEQRILLKEMKAWMELVEAKLSTETESTARMSLMSILLAAEFCYSPLYCALDDTGTMWESRKGSCLETLRITRSILRDAPSSSKNNYSLLFDGIVPGVISLARECPDQQVRAGALDICQGLVSPSSSWDIKAILLGTTAIVETEEAGRNEAGLIPLEFRYNWTHAFWNDDFSEFHVTLTAKIEVDGAGREEKHVVLRPDQFGLA